MTLRGADGLRSLLLILPKNGDKTGIILPLSHRKTDTSLRLITPCFCGRSG